MAQLTILVLTLFTIHLGICFKDQYHIQSDLGEIKFFKYSTHGGQYRKETRLDDGTVVGTYGWVDGNNVVRYTDYIADSRGYRIINQRKSYLTHEDENSTTESSINEIVNEPKRKVIKRRRARKRNIYEDGSEGTIKRRLGVAEISSLNLFNFHSTPGFAQEVSTLRTTPGFAQVVSTLRTNTFSEAFKTSQEPLAFQETLPFQEPLLLANQYPSAGDRPYIRLLGEHAIITVPREDAIITVRKEEDANLTFPEQEDAAINKVSDEDNLSSVRLPSQVLLTKIKADLSNISPAPPTPRPRSSRPRPQLPSTRRILRMRKRMKNTDDINVSEKNLNSDNDLDKLLFEVDEATSDVNAVYFPAV